MVSGPLSVDRPLASDILWAKLPIRAKPGDPLSTVPRNIVRADYSPVLVRAVDEIVGSTGQPCQPQATSTRSRITGADL